MPDDRQGLDRRPAPPGTKKYFALRWNEPVLDSQGQPALDKEGKVQYRTMTESCKTSDRVTAQALAEKKFAN